LRAGWCRKNQESAAPVGADGSRAAAVKIRHVTPEPRFVLAHNKLGAQVLISSCEVTRDESAVYRQDALARTGVLFDLFSFQKMPDGLSAST
jgi:hypothetical protein